MYRWQFSPVRDLMACPHAVTACTISSQILSLLPLPHCRFFTNTKGKVARAVLQVVGDPHYLFSSILLQKICRVFNSHSPSTGRNKPTSSKDMGKGTKPAYTGRLQRTKAIEII